LISRRAAEQGAHRFLFDELFTEHTGFLALIKLNMTPKSQSKQRVAPAIDLLSFAGEHLFYEVQMFVSALAIQPGSDQFVMNLKVEDAVLHLRNLIEFFYPSNPRPDDILAAHYVAGWDAKRPTITPLLEKARGRAGKELHHLTAQRIAGKTPEKAWDFGAIRNEMKAVVAAFLGQSPNIPQKTISELMKI
jgi:hypothetical protein